MKTPEQKLALLEEVMLTQFKPLIPTMTYAELQMYARTLAKKLALVEAAILRHPDHKKENAS